LKLNSAIDLCYYALAYSQKQAVWAFQDFQLE
jgi:hypothetical protein